MGIRSRIGAAAKALFGPGGSGGGLPMTGPAPPSTAGWLRSAVFPNFGNQYLGGMADWPRGVVSPALFGILPGATLDFAREAGELWLNETVSLAVNWIADRFLEADPVAVVPGVTEDDDAPTPEANPLLDLLDTPNEFDSADTLWGATLLSFTCDGNAYWHKVRSGDGRVAELWWLPHWAVRPRWDWSRNAFIDYYEYQVRGSFYRLEVADVLHFRNGKNPDNQRLGQSRLKASLRTIVGDNEGAGFELAVLKNMGIAPHVATPKVGVLMTPDDAVNLKREWKAKQGGDRRGDLAFIPGSLDITKIGFSPEELMVPKTRSMMQSRILAAVGLNAMSLGLPDEDRTYANYGEAIKDSLHRGLDPLHSRLGRAINRDPDLQELLGGKEMAWDFDHIPARQEDQVQKGERLTAIWINDGIAHDEYRQGLGYEPDPAHEGEYYSDMQAAKQQQQADHQAGLDAEAADRQAAIGQDAAEQGADLQVKVAKQMPKPKPAGGQ